MEEMARWFLLDKNAILRAFDFADEPCGACPVEIVRLENPGDIRAWLYDSKHLSLVYKNFMRADSDVFIAVLWVMWWIQ